MERFVKENCGMTIKEDATFSHVLTVISEFCWDHIKCRRKAQSKISVFLFYSF